ncbi:methylmalonyl-CoA mutase family protein [Cytophagaceae bacterium YF14B1]|uniref:Fused isobutyryl-CoA mutase n=1 Tax=Xanthocytophaga flava TaxID=3048013 RepID=A0AAE3U520_9BACT|nr:methylmalonyl-CoA mutase family protein [Xanthocytophaga flavus]MDJ1479087.1 methylmalonyl-CoA mutase family protein [Xanthocytophaga flavus]
MATIYKPENHIRIVTAASLFDGHDAAINIMRRILQSSGAEIIHLGHNRSVAEIVECAIQEDVQGIAITSYQGGHIEFFKYMYDLLQEKGAGHIRIFGGGGGTILPLEATELHQYGITRIYSPDDGRTMGLQGMINDLLEKCDFDVSEAALKDRVNAHTITASLLSRININALFQDHILTGSDDVIEPEVIDVVSNLSRIAIPRLITIAENYPDFEGYIRARLQESLGKVRKVPVLGITGTGGAGKSSMVDELVRRYLLDFPDKTIAIISVDPSKRKTGGALLGDRIRMNAIFNPRVYMRSLATRQSNLALSRYVQDAIDICKIATFDLIIVETSGIGQSDTEIVDHSDVSLYLMTSDYGAATQLEKIDMLDFADVIAINKFDKRGSLDALREVRKQYKRNRNAWDAEDETLPIYGTIASQFNDSGTHTLYQKIISLLHEKTGSFEGGKLSALMSLHPERISQSRSSIIPPEKVRYLAEIVEKSLEYDQFIQEQTRIARQLYQLKGTIDLLRGKASVKKESEEGMVTPYQEGEAEELKSLINWYQKLDQQLHHECRQLLNDWKERVQQYKDDKYQYKVRDKVFEQDLYTETLSHLRIPKISLPRYEDWGDLLRWMLTENVPGEFPFTAGVFPLKREGEDPTRMFAGEGGPERTNRRFHYLSKGMPAKRLSTAFDSVTLYGENPDHRPDIYGKVGMSGVSVCTLDDAKKLYSGFNLCDPATSVSMTINGPAPMLLGFFLNAAIDQQCELYIRKHNLEQETNQKVLTIIARRFFKSLEVQTFPDNEDSLEQAAEAEEISSEEYIERFGFDTTLDLSFASDGKVGIVVAMNKEDYRDVYIQQLTEESPAVQQLLYPETWKEWRGLWIPEVLYQFMPAYNGKLPEGNDGLGLMLLGVTGDEVLSQDIYETIKADTLKKVRGTVQADILKEDQAQNTCIFSTEFALRMMGDIQQYFIEKQIQNFYSVSISGYHIAEAGANPISQLAFTLSNGFTFVEYYLSRGMHIDDFAPNLSFFFSNGMDPEYTVLGRVARRIWAKAMKFKYKGNSRSQRLKYHIQTSGRSLHAQEIAFNDIRTTLQALCAIYDNCNSLHTNAYDEAITTPTEESVRRAMAIQLIINKEWGLTKNENPLQGSFIIEELTDLVEQAVYQEFNRINERGGVLGAMETMYQRSQIQEESLYYETQKHNGKLPVIGVNTFLDPQGSPTLLPAEVFRSSQEEKNFAIDSKARFETAHLEKSEQVLTELQKIAVQNKNTFESLMEVCKFCSLGQITHALYEVGGQYRRNM